MSTPNNGWQTGGGWNVPQPGAGPAQQPPASAGGWGPTSAPGGGWSAPQQPVQPQAPAPAHEEFKTTSAPHTLLLPSLILALVSLILDAIVGFGPLRSIDTQWGVLTGVAWALSGIVGVSALGLYFTKNTEARANGLYEIVGWKQTLFYATIAALAIAVVISSVMFALWFGRQ